MPLAAAVRFSEEGLRARRLIWESSGMLLSHLIDAEPKHGEEVVNGGQVRVEKNKPMHIVYIVLLVDSKRTPPPSRCISL